MKRLIATCLMTVGVSAYALDTSLVLESSGADQTSVIDISPGLGILNKYEVTESGSVRRAFVNFLSELELYERLIFEERNGVPFSALRIGSTNNRPTTEELLRQLPNAQTAAEKAANKPSLQARARAAEDAFWTKEHKFDGVVRGAYDGTYVMLCAPSKHVLMIYEVSGDKIELRGWRNYGAELLVPRGMNTMPNPDQIAGELTPEEKAEFEKEQEEQRKKEEEGAIAETPKSDVWMVAGPGHSFVVVDTLNRVIMAYQFAGKNLEIKSIRNISQDLLIRRGWHTQPLPSQEVEAFNRDPRYRSLSVENGIETDEIGLRALAAGSAAGEQSKSALQATFINNLVVLDFTDQHKLLTYDFNGGTQLNLASSRDYTIDLGIAMAVRLFNEKAQAKQLLAQCKTTRSHALAMTQLKSALKLDPTLVTVVEKDSKLQRELANEADWGPTLDQAHKDVEALEAKKKAIKDKAQAERDANKKP
jgi:hypothetical protein